ncbi:MAG: hypothetical protein K8R67_08165 [Desulfobacteraceae bacterium]|nr:hypothetical protein [Desulfobacteraceae bacterium]
MVLRIWNTAILLSLCGPLGLWFSDFYPPTGTTFLFNAVLSITIVAIGSVLAMTSSSKGDLALKVGRKYLYASIAFIVLYVIIYSFGSITVFQKQNGIMTQHRVAIGYELKKTMPKGDPPKKLIKNFFPPSNIWTKKSILITNGALTATYNLSFFLMTYGLILIQKSKLVSSKKGKKI